MIIKCKCGYSWDTTFSILTICPECERSGDDIIREEKHIPLEPEFQHEDWGDRDSE